jgi:hypothetical protein
VGETEECLCSPAVPSAVDDRPAAARTPAPPTKTLRREVVLTVEVVRSLIESSCSRFVNTFGQSSIHTIRNTKAPMTNAAHELRYYHPKSRLCISE